MSERRTNIEIIAPTVEEAKAKGLKELGVSEADVEIEVLDEGGKGLFGLGGRDARIRITLMSGGSSPTKNNSSNRQASLSNSTNLLAAVETTESIVKDLLDKMHLNAKVEVHTDNHMRPDGSRVCSGFEGRNAPPAL